mmetsp:Transcript_9058/g.12450  ORF Transcript_9058/g.12450 Transcript_9058/m.12450 type:complete len:240 (+) Transcript_9058:110-829(+)|eukprot:CAMPEP_0168547590 /NCGR_PEP_ID=MMETSP0413-20121227/4116_1 /TAXON_ID=136452 /ORGANISM="Filamoeba nolandi, Strain NC-AS-23-1" /LENGTH=239 /DNA_ID=CAMNT_0008577851 /DNA_START=56 /DNA_END=775 /DNA_ORIENTATION=+
MASTGMDEEEVSKQLDHMVKFIYREAEEKANEIHAKAQEEFSIEKAKIVQEEKLKIQKEFERKEKQIETKKKILFSNELNASRLKVLKIREEGIQKIISLAHSKMQAITQDESRYKKLLHGLILQGLLKLKEPKVSIICREEDVRIVKGLLSAVVAEYKKQTSLATDVEVDSETFLPPSPAKAGKDGVSCSGGIILSTNEGRIICSNTLDARLQMAYEQNLPLIRNTVFGKSTTRKHDN